MSQTSAPHERRISAIAVSRGIGIGKVEFLQTPEIAFSQIPIDPTRIDAEVIRFRQAVESVRSRLAKLSDPARPDTSEAVSTIFEVQRLILESSFADRVENLIREQNANSEWAIREASNFYKHRQASVGSDHIREKEIDIGDVAVRLLAELGAARTGPTPHVGAIIVGQELRPSTVIELARFQPAAFVTERGGWTSHTSILAREFEIPMVSGVNLSNIGVVAGDSVVVNGNSGELILNPSFVTSKEFIDLAAAKGSGAYEEMIDSPAITLDGTQVAIRTNLESGEAYQIAEKKGARGIGLFRSESLIGIAGLPTEEQQYLAYMDIAAATGAAGVNIRTFDIGLDQLEGDVNRREINPALGLRSIRRSFAEPHEFRSQLRAIVRANVDGNVSLLIPMIAGPSEILRSRIVLGEVVKELADFGIEATPPRLGAMIELPAAVFTAREIAQNADFICLGTNDLVQYLLAVDRDNDRAAEWYQTLHPAVLRAIRIVAEAGEEAGIPVIACGEMASSAFYVPLLMGLGIRDLSIAVNSIRTVCLLINGIKLSDASDLAQRALACDSSDAVERLLRTHYADHWSGLFPDGILDATHR
ncbi:MAG: phosphoenolpyruvate--protein phosphotransferase [Pyrinomonadaceae bacterium]